VRGLGVVGVAAIVLTLAGLLVLWGSVGPWGTCPQFPCDPGPDDVIQLFAVEVRSGIEVRAGLVTALAGLGMVWAALATIVTGASNRVVGLALGSAGLALLSVAAYLTVMNVILRSQIVASYGLYGGVVGAAVGFLAGLVMRRATRVDARSEGSAVAQ
jgi:hypothetical protein